jgi:hypothetical protein
VIECLPRICGTLGSIPSTKRERQRDRERERERERDVHRWDENMLCRPKVQGVRWPPVSGTMNRLNHYHIRQESGHWE